LTRDPGTPCDEAAYQALLEDIRAEFPRFRLIRKSESLLQRSIHVVLALLTFGGQRRYLHDYVTTLGARVYVPPRWDQRSPADRVGTMRHERVHLRQFRRYGLLPMGLLYLLIPLPFGLAYFRMRFEREAYEESIRAAWELQGPDCVLHPSYRRHMVRIFTGPAYGWMWPMPRQIERWFDGLVAELVESSGLSPKRLLYLVREPARDPETDGDS
jgi:hypothetical protein